jgi:hypothetical protein
MHLTVVVVDWRAAAAIGALVTATTLLIVKLAGPRAGLRACRCFGAFLLVGGLALGRIMMIPAGLLIIGVATWALRDYPPARRTTR